MNKERNFRKKAWKPLAIVVIAGVMVVAVLGITGVMGSKKKEPQIITTSALYKIVNVSKLSTYQCVYNAICTVKDEEGNVSYYISYEAKVNAGIAFDEIRIDVDEEGKTVNISIPETEITGVNVDIASLDYMFVDSKLDQSKISEKAYKACIEDVERRTEEESNIRELAQQNAENTVKALVKPFIEQIDNEYVLNIKSMTSEEEEKTNEE